MHCLMCSCANGSLQQLQKNEVNNILEQIFFVLPALTIPDTKNAIFGCSTCVKQIETFYRIKQTSLGNIHRLNRQKNLLKKNSDMEFKEFQILFENQDVLPEPKLDIEFIKIEPKYENLLSSKNEVQFTGKDSNSTFVDEQSKKEHMIGQGRFKCSNCQKAFTEQCDLKTHTCIYREKSLYKCPTCQKEFSDSKNLNAHKLSHIDSNSTSITKQLNKPNRVKHKQYECKFCQKILTSPSGLVVHTRIHTGEKPYECTVCQKTFNNSSSLNVHTFTHTGETPYKCDVCHKSFNNKSTLVKHGRTHTRTIIDTRTYQCEECSEAFRLTLLKQIRSRIEDKPYQCHMCQYKSLDASHLKRHIETHKGKKPFTCLFCQKSYV